jgi:hypothetical protein
VRSFFLLGFLVNGFFAPTGRRWEDALEHWRTLSSDDDAAWDSQVSIDAAKQRPDLDGEAVLLSLESGKYYGLDSVGSRIWQFVQRTPLLRSVWQSMQDEFDAPADTLHKDLLAFIDELSVEGLITLQ